MADNRFKIKNGLVINEVGAEITGSLNATGSIYLVGAANIVSIPSYQSTDFFLIRNNTTTFRIASSSGVEITSSAQIPFQVNNQTSQSIFYVSQSGITVFATSSTELAANSAPNGAIYFTATDFFVGLS